MKFLAKSIIILLFLFWASSSLATSTEELEKRIELLEKELKMLRQELAIQKQSQEKSTDSSKILKDISDHISIKGIIEVEGYHSKGFDNSEESDVKLATAQLEVEGRLNDYVSGNIIFLYEEDETEPVDVDEAYITIGNTEKYPIYLKAGKQYLPLGEFDTNMISDPLTLELAQINKSAITIGANYHGFFLEGSIFNGDIDKTKKQNEGLNHIDEFAMYGGYATEINNIALNAWIGYMNNLGDSDTVSDYLNDNNNSMVKDYVGAICANLAIDFQNISLYASYAGATKSFKKNEIAYNDKGAKPKAWNVELGYGMPILGYDTTLAVGYQQTDEALALELPKHRYIGTISVNLLENLSLSLEYAYDKDYDKDEGGTDETAQTVTTQLHLEF